jgi:hypothetical protein
MMSKSMHLPLVLIIFYEINILKIPTARNRCTISRERDGRCVNIYVINYRITWMLVQDGSSLQYCKYNVYKESLYSYLGIQFEGVRSTSHDENRFIGTGFAAWCGVPAEEFDVVPDRFCFSDILTSNS